MTITLREKRQGGVPARSRDYYEKALREYLDLYGELTAACFSPGAAKRNGRPDLVDLYYKGRPSADGSFPDPAVPWPSLNSIKAAFGGFDAAREALELKPNSTGPPGGRRAPGEAKPIVAVRERRVVIPDASTSWLETQLGKARRRVMALETQLESTKAKLQDDSQIVVLRKRLQDESSRRRELTRAKRNAETRERARMREVERLTERLAEVQSREPKTITKTVTRAVPGKPRGQTKIVTRTVKVQDQESLRRAQRLEAQLAAARTECSRVEERRLELAERLADIRREAIASALATQLVQSAQRKVAEVERQLALQAELLVGERRQLTQEEIEKLRKDGPDSRVTFAAAVKRIARAEGKIARSRAIDDAMVVLQNWKDQLL